MFKKSILKFNFIYICIYMILLCIIIFLAIFYIFSNSSKENFTFEEIATSNVKENDELSITFNKDEINEIIEINNYVNGNVTEKPNSLIHIPENLMNLDMCKKILYDTYIINFIDRYIVERFNYKIFLDVNYYYPNYSSFSNESDSERNKLSLNKFHNDLLNETVNNINLETLDDDFYLFTLSDFTKNEFKELDNNFRSINTENFTNFYNTIFKKFILKILNKLNIYHIGSSNISERFFIFKFTELNNDNFTDIFQNTVDILENEINLINKYNLN